MKPEFVEHVRQRRARLGAELAAVVPAKSSIVLEIGCGHGHFLARYAAENPAKLCLGVDVIGERIARATRKAARAKLANCHFIRGEARELIESLPPGVTFAETWVLFPDPWPKKRHHKNRILQPAFFAFLASRVEQGSRLYFRTDHAEYFKFVADFLPGLTSWQPDPTAIWPLEHETVFQARAPAYQSLVAVKT
ncbi:MAG TPA: methyltransferase domain-containing protein [Fibrobacteria bacterium]|jgi:tRNA (guanine-N7-)-methyltransferase|nr:methyltransferase domain-containing protein [Fibrobacteria bacterium]